MKPLALVLFALPLCVSAGQDPLSLLDKWDYAEPAATREKFRAELKTANLEADRDYVVVLLTQVARTYSLQGAFETAHAELDGARPLIDDKQSAGYVLYLLERGRTWNSAGERQKAVEPFREAFEVARSIGNDYLAVDAAHMLGIAVPLEQQHTWNQRALEIAEQSDEERAKNWLGTLYNNIGWTWFDQGEYARALELFRKGVEFRREEGQRRRLQIARWAVGRTLRAMGRDDQALEIQRALEAENERLGLPADGYVLEELAELYRGRDQALATEYFRRAWALLSQDPWLQAHEPERLARMKKLAESEPDQ